MHPQDKSGSLKVREVNSETEAEAVVAEESVMMAQQVSDAVNRAARHYGISATEDDVGPNGEQNPKEQTRRISDHIDSSNAEMMRPKYF